MTTNWKALCAELVNSWAEGLNIVGPMHHARALLDQPEPPSRLRHCSTHGQQPENAWGCPECVREMRQQLAQPEPEGLTDEELLRCYGLAKRDHCYEGPIDDWPNRAERAATVHGLRAVIAADRARWGRPAVEPVPVSEGMPGPEDVSDDGEVWVEEPSYDYALGDTGDYDSEPGRWVLRPFSSLDKCKNRRWLAHHALPVPTTSTETNGQT